MSSMYSANDPGYKWSPITLHVLDDVFIQCSVLSAWHYMSTVINFHPPGWNFYPYAFTFFVCINNLHLLILIFLVIIIVISLPSTPTPPPPSSTLPPPSFPPPPTTHHYMSPTILPPSHPLLPPPFSSNIKVLEVHSNNCFSPHYCNSLMLGRQVEGLHY